jgi:hypothetical protein
MVDPIAQASAISLSEAAKPMANHQAGVNFSVSDVARFEAAMSPNSASASQQMGMVQFDGTTQATNAVDLSVAKESTAVKAMFDPLDKINNISENFMFNAETLAAKPEISPGDMLMTMVNVQKFMLQCQAASSVANRTSDGIQELFKQQS